MQTTITDKYNDTIEIDTDLYDGSVDLTIYEDDEEASVNLQADQIQDLIAAVGGVRASDVSLNEALIRVAAVHGAHVTFRYVKDLASPVELRTFVPTSVRSMGDHVTFVGDDEDRDAIRSFRSDRIRGTVQVTA